MAEDGGSAPRSIDKAAQQMLKKTQELGLETIWDRYEAQTPVCKFECVAGSAT